MAFSTREDTSIGGVLPGDVGEGVQLDLTAEEAVGNFKMVYISSDNSFSIADNTVAGKDKAFGIAENAIALGEEGKITTKGKVTNPAWSFSPTVGPEA